MATAIRYTLCVFLITITPVATLFSQNPPGGATAPNSDPTYQQLRNITLGGEAVAVNNLTLRRDAARFHLNGTVCFVAPVQGKVTGAVFVGEGNLVLEPPLDAERRSMGLLTKEAEFSEKFSEMALRFTDDTYDEIKKAGSIASGSCSPGILSDSQNALRKRLRYNLSARILQDVLSTEPGSLFVAFIHGKRYSDKLVYALDPHGAPPLAIATFGEDALVFSLSPEEVELLTYEDNKAGYWAAFHLSPEYKAGSATGTQRNAVISIEHQQLDTSIGKNAHLNGKAETTVISQVNGLRVVPFDLYRTLRVQSASLDGQALPFIQEDKNEDSQYFVILPKPLSKGEKATIATVYDGKDAVMNTGGGNYFPIAREDWYPNNPGAALGEYTQYDLTFRIPKNMKMAATGTMVSENNQGDQSVSVWKSEVPLSVAGFNFGRFKKESVDLQKPQFTIAAYANEEPPDWVRSLQHAASGDDIPVMGQSHITGYALGNMETTGLNKKAMAEGQVAIQIYSDYFGPASYKHLAVTQQTACGFGQAWPELVWIPICYYFDTTVRHQLGLDFGDRGYWRSVTPHEVAHQWWGHTVGFNSYRDQWMSEGFAELSASLYLQMVYSKEPKRYMEFWDDQRELLTMRNKEGYRAIDVGPLTMGYRLNNSRAGVNVTRDLIYPKGGYILHMVRMMMRDRQGGDQKFKETMRDFVQTYANRAASTEDFKAMVEKHMTRRWISTETIGWTGSSMSTFTAPRCRRTNLTIPSTPARMATWCSISNWRSRESTTALPCSCPSISNWRTATWHSSGEREWQGTHR
jgi:peptidase M1-like protein